MVASVSLRLAGLAALSIPVDVPADDRVLVGALRTLVLVLRP